MVVDVESELGDEESKKAQKLGFDGFIFSHRMLGEAPLLPSGLSAQEIWTVHGVQICANTCTKYGGIP